MSLEQRVAGLTQANRYKLGIDLLDLALPLWTEYTSDPSRLEYADSVVGAFHTVDKNIIQRVINFARSDSGPYESQKELTKLKEEFMDPIVSLQDCDWALPREVELVFYAAYNLMNKFNGDNKTIFGEDQMYVVINQEVDALNRSGIMSYEQVSLFIKKYEASL